MILTFARRAASEAGSAGDDGTNDLLISEVVRIGESQVWFNAEHLAATSLQSGNPKLIGVATAGSQT